MHSPIHPNRPAANGGNSTKHLDTVLCFPIVGQVLFDSMFSQANIFNRRCCSQQNVGAGSDWPQIWIKRKEDRLMLLLSTPAQNGAPHIYFMAGCAHSILAQGGGGTERGTLNTITLEDAFGALVAF